MAEVIVNRVGPQEFRGSITALNDTITIGVRDYATAGVSITGTWTGSITIEGTHNGVNWVAVKAHDLAYAAVTLPVTANAQISAPIVPIESLRVLASAAMTGTALVKITLNCGISYVFTVAG